MVATRAQSARVVGERWRYFVHIVHLEELYFDNPVVGSACRRLFAGITGKKGCYQEEEKNPGCFHCRFLFSIATLAEYSRLIYNPSLNRRLLKAGSDQKASNYA
jgi:hypothetical protein